MTLLNLKTIMENQQIRLQKHLADLGVGSRRKCEEYITAGLISVNGTVVTELGTKVDPANDKVTWDPQLVAAKAGRIRYIMLNKPAGIVTTCASHVSEPTILDLVKVPERIFPIGRLDKDTTGLIILTNDGLITHKLLHPSFGKEKEYEVVVDGHVTEARAAKIREGVNLFGEKTLPTKVEILGERKLKIILQEGKNRQVRRICQKVGLIVMKLKRTRMNRLWLDPKLKEGQWRDLTKDEVGLLTNL